MLSSAKLKYSDNKHTIISSENAEKLQDKELALPTTTTTTAKLPLSSIRNATNVTLPSSITVPEITLKLATAALDTENVEEVFKTVRRSKSPVLVRLHLPKDGIDSSVDDAGELPQEKLDQPTENTMDFVTTDEVESSVMQIEMTEEIEKNNVELPVVEMDIAKDESLDGQRYLPDTVQPEEQSEMDTTAEEPEKEQQDLGLDESAAEPEKQHEEHESEATLTSSQPAIAPERVPIASKLPQATVSVPLPAPGPVPLPVPSLPQPSIPTSSSSSTTNAGFGRSLRTRPQEHTPYHSRSLRLRALANAAQTPSASASTSSTSTASNKSTDEIAAITKKNTIANKQHHAKLIITLVPKDGPRPPSPSQALREKTWGAGGQMLLPAESPATSLARKRKINFVPQIDLLSPSKPPARTKRGHGAPKPVLRKVEEVSTRNEEPGSPPIVTIQRFVYREDGGAVAQQQEVEQPVKPTGTKRKK